MSRMLLQQHWLLQFSLVSYHHLVSVRTANNHHPPRLDPHNEYLCNSLLFFD